MSSPESRIFDIKVWQKRGATRGRIYPPKDGEALERSLKGMEKLTELDWPLMVDAHNVYIVQLWLNALGQEFMAAALQDHPQTSLDFGVNRQNRLLASMKQKLNAEQKKELIAANDEASKIICNRIEPRNAHARLHAAYRNHPEDNLSPERYLLLTTAQQYLEWETMAGRAGYGKEPNIWGKLIDMYNAGMYSYQIKPASGQLEVDIQVRRDSEIATESFIIPPLKVA